MTIFYTNYFRCLGVSLLCIAIHSALAQSVTVPPTPTSARTILFTQGQVLIEQNEDHLIYVEIIDDQLQFTVEDLKDDYLTKSRENGKAWHCGKLSPNNRDRAMLEIDVNQNGQLDANIDCAQYQMLMGNNIPAYPVLGTYPFTKATASAYFYDYPFDRVNQLPTMRTAPGPVLSGSQSLERTHVIHRFLFPLEHINLRNWRLNVRIVVFRADDEHAPTHSFNRYFGSFFYPGEAACLPGEATFYTIDFTQSQHPALEAARRLTRFTRYPAQVKRTQTQSVASQPSALNYQKTVDYDGVYFQVKQAQLAQAVQTPVRMGKQYTYAMSLGSNSVGEIIFSFEHQTLNLPELNRIVLAGPEFSGAKLAVVGVYEVKLVDDNGSNFNFKDLSTDKIYTNDQARFYTLGTKVLTHRRQSAPNQYELLFAESLIPDKEYVLYTPGSLFYFRVLRVGAATNSVPLAKLQPIQTSLPSTDGVYLKTTNNTYAAIPVTKGTPGYLVLGTHNGESFAYLNQGQMARRMALRETDFTVSNVLELPRAKADALILKGSYDLQYLQFYPLKKTFLTDYRDFTIHSNLLDNPFKKAGYNGLLIVTEAPIPLTQRKTVSADETHIQLPYLAPGAYALNMGQSLWLINIKVN